MRRRRLRDQSVLAGFVGIHNQQFCELRKDALQRVEGRGEIGRIGSHALTPLTDHGEQFERLDIFFGDGRRSAISVYFRASGSPRSL